MDMRNDPELNKIDHDFFAVIRDEKIYGFSDSKARALEILNELCNKDLENAPNNKVYRKEYDELNMNLKVYSKAWTMGVFPYEKLEHIYFISLMSRIF